MPATREIKVDYLTRVEGEGAMYLKVRDGEVVDLRFEIFEPPRFFEAFMRGRSFAEAPDITARICGICPVAYQMSAVNAMEDALGVEVGEDLRQLRRLLYCGEWIESHALHVYLLHAPDFLGYESAIHMAKDHPEVVKRGLALKKAGNEIAAVVGGREIHPINVKVGGFYRAPSRSELLALVDRLQQARDIAVETVRWVSGFTFPGFEQDYEFVAMSHPDEYPFATGRIVSSKGLDIGVQDYDEHFVEEHVEHSTALHARLRERGAYKVGPLARYSINFEKLSPVAQEVATRAGLGPECRNPFQSIIVRSVEMVEACEEALRIIDGYRPPPLPAEEAKPAAGVGRGASEAPRGLLYHYYELDDDGNISDARIVPPTSQNQKMIEDDLRRFVSTRLDLPDDKLQWRLEQAIRNYDPCISCSTHFLKLEVDRD
jgi:coenzyme F420-reducing hydrogenase alpha subunit